MNNTKKYRLSQLATVFGGVSACITLGKIIPYGIGGQIQDAKLLIVWFFISTSAGIGGAFMMTMYKTVDRNNSEIEDIAIKTLSNQGAEILTKKTIQQDPKKDN